MKQIDDVWFTQEPLGTSLASFDSETVEVQSNKTIIIPSKTATVRLLPKGGLYNNSDLIESTGEQGDNDFDPGGRTYFLGTFIRDDANPRFCWGEVIKWTDAQIKAIADRDLTTSAPLLDSFDLYDEHLDIHAGGAAETYYTQGWNGVIFPTITDARATDGSNGIGEITGTAYIELYWSNPAGITNNNTSMELRILSRRGPASGFAGDLSTFLKGNIPADSYQLIPFNSRNELHLDMAVEFGWAFGENNKRVGDKDILGYTNQYPMVVVCRRTVFNTSGHTGTWNDTTLANIKHLSLIVPYKPVEINDFYIAGSGAMFGSYIDDGGRSNDYDEGDLIEDPAFMIEDILRTHVGVPDANIDTASYDAAANSNVQARLNIHANNKASSNTFIKQLVEQSTFRHCWTLDAKSRLLPLNDESPTTTVIIPFSHIKGGKINISRTSKTYNVLNIQHRFLQEYGGIFRDFTQIKHSTSEDGENQYDSTWENITGDSATHVGNHLMGNENALLPNEHLLVDIEMTGATGIHLQLGDYYELDPNTCDAQIKPYGVSWNGIQLFIYSIKHGMIGTKLKGIQIFT